MITSLLDLPVLVEWLGADGVRAALRASKKLTLSDLRELSARYGVDPYPKAKKNAIIDLLILQFDRRITKPIEEMKAMSSSELFEYLDRTQCSKEEVQSLFGELGFSFKKADSRTALIRHVAEQISDLGMYQRIAGDQSKPSTQ